MSAMKKIVMGLLCLSAGERSYGEFAPLRKQGCLWRWRLHPERRRTRHQLHVDRTLMEAGASVTVTPVIVGAAAPYCTWTFRNLAGGEPVVCETDGLVACAQQLDVPGLYRILLSVTDGDNAAEAELAGRVTVRATGTYFVSKTGGGVPPFDIWEKAATNLTVSSTSVATRR